MATVTYTEHKNVRTSEAVKGLWYDQNKHNLTVQLTSGGYYTYGGVTRPIFERLINASSMGREFASIKRNHGPGKRLHGENLTLVPVSVEVNVQSNRAGAAGPHITLTSNGESRFNLAPGAYTARDPQALASAAQSRVFNAASIPVRRHVVNFTIEGSNERSFETQAQSVDKAIENLAEALSVVGLTATVKTVVTHLG